MYWIMTRLAIALHNKGDLPVYIDSTFTIKVLDTGLKDDLYFGQMTAGPLSSVRYDSSVLMYDFPGGEHEVELTLWDEDGKLLVTKTKWVTPTD